MKLHFARRRALAVAGVCASALAIAACGSSSSSSSSASSGSGATASASTTSGASGTTSSSSSSSSASAFAAAQQANAHYEQRPTSIGITTPVGAPIPKGKTIDFIQCGVPACAVEGSILRSATNLLGWKLVSVNAGSTPQTITAAYQQAITNKPDAVIGSGYPRALFAPEVKTLASMHIPVLEAFVADSTGNGMYVVGGPKLNAIQGKEVADYLLANSTNTKETFGSVVPSGFPNMVQENTAFQAEIKSQCSGCSVKPLIVPVTSIGSDLPTRVSTFLTANPSIAATWLGYDDMVSGIPVALKGAGIMSAKLATISMNSTVASSIKSGDYVQTGIGVSFPETYWREIDLLARMFAGKSFKVDLNDATLPVWTITKSNLPSNAGATLFANVVNYQQQFKKLWGLG
jgi:ribose transport system substrate-binding protein